MRHLMTLLFISLLILCGCDESRKDKVGTVPVITVDLSKEQVKIDLKDLIKNTSFIRLETNRDCLLRGVSKVGFYKDRIFVFDSSYPGHLYCFNLDGKFLFKVGNVGNGPRDYVSILDFVVDTENSCLWMGDDARKILQFDLDGNFVEKYTTDFSIRNLCLLDAKEISMAIRLGFYKEKDYSFIVYSLRDGKIHYEKSSENVEVSRSVTSQTFFKSKERVVYTEIFNDTIFTVSDKGLSPYYVVDFGSRKLPENLFDNPDLRNIMTQLNNPDNRYAGLITTPREISDILLFNYNFSGVKNTAFYSVGSNKTISINEISFAGKTFNFLSGSFHLKQDNQVVYVLLPHLLMEDDALSKGDSQQNYGRYSDIDEFLPNLKADDNPIMIIGEFDSDKLFPR